MNKDINHQSVEGSEKTNSPTDVYVHLSSIIDTIAGNHWREDKFGHTLFSTATKNFGFQILLIFLFFKMGSII